MSLEEIIEGLTAGEMAGWGLVLLFGLLSLIQVSPLKLNPWDRIFAWVGKKMNGATEKRLEELASQSGLTVSKYIHKILEEHF